MARGSEYDPVCLLFKITVILSIQIYNYVFIIQCPTYSITIKTNDIISFSFSLCFSFRLFLSLRVPSNCGRNFNLLAFDPEGDRVVCELRKTVPVLRLSGSVS